MKSKVAVTYLIDDSSAAAQELTSRILDNFELCKNSLGILYSYSDMELAPFVAELSGALPFPVVGCTCAASIDSHDGTHELAATLLVMTADDCTFSPVMTGVIHKGNVEQEVTTAYHTAAAALPDAPKLILAFPPYNLDIMLDEYPAILNRIAPGVPTVGGLHTSGGDEDASGVFFNGLLCEGCMVMVLVTGNIHPVFSVRSVAGSPIERKRKVTKSVGNVIYTVGDQRFTDYLMEIGLPLDKLVAASQTIAYITNPLLLENISQDGTESFSFVRTLYATDLEKGTGTAIGRVPEGATLSVCSLNRSDIQEGGRNGVERILQEMEKNPDPAYSYSTVLAVSCIGRHTILLPNSRLEADGMLSLLPGSLSMIGFYSHGEIGPLSTANGQLVNHAHNESLILCAF